MSDFWTEHDAVTKTPEFNALPPVEKRKYMARIWMNSPERAQMPPQEQQKFLNKVQSQWADKPKPFDYSKGNYIPSEAAGPTPGASPFKPLQPQNPYKPPDRKQIDDYKLRFFNTLNPNANIPMLTAFNLSHDPNHPVSKQVYDRLSTVGKAAVDEKIAEFHKDYEYARNWKPGKDPAGFAPPSFRRGSMAVASMVQGPESAKQLEEAKGFVPAAQRFAYQMTNPAEVAQLIAAPQGKVPAAIFGGMAAKSGIEKMRQGDPGGAYFDFLLGLVPAALHGVKELKKPPSPAPSQAGATEPAPSGKAIVTPPKAQAPELKGEVQDATLQKERVDGPTKEDVRAGEAGKAGKGRGVGEGESVEGEAPTRTRQEEKEVITQAAYKHEGKVETGPHHPGILERLGVKGFESAESRNTPEFGFVTDKGRFVSREEAAKIAKSTGQDLVGFEKGEPAHSDEIAKPGTGTPISESKSPWPKARTSVENAMKSRGIRGDSLLNAMDLADELSSKNAEISPDGMVTLYHRTTPENAQAIAKTGKMTSKEDRLFFGTHPEGQIEGYGDAAVKVRLPLEKLELNDVFSNEAHVTLKGTSATVKAEVWKPQQKPETQISEGKLHPEIEKAVSETTERLKARRAAREAEKPVGETQTAKPLTGEAQPIKPVEKAKIPEEVKSSEEIVSPAFPRPVLSRAPTARGTRTAPEVNVTISKPIVQKRKYGGRTSIDVKSEDGNTLTVTASHSGNNTIGYTQAKATDPVWSVQKAEYRATTDPYAQKTWSTIQSGLTRKEALERARTELAKPPTPKPPPAAAEGGKAKRIIPSVGKTAKDVYREWENLSSGEKVYPGTAVQANVLHVGTFEYRNGKIVRVDDVRLGTRSGTVRDATNAEMNEIDDAIKNGRFQLERRQIARYGTSSQTAPKETTTLHQATGFPLEEKSSLTSKLKSAEEAASERLQSRKRGLQSGIDPEDLKDLSILVSAKIARHGIEAVDMTAKWAKELVQEWGDWVKPHLQAIYDAAKAHYEQEFKKYAEAPSEKPSGGKKKPYSLLREMEEGKQETLTPKPLYEMNQQELDSHYDQIKKSDDARMLKILGGKEGLDRYNALLRAEGSMDKARSDKASAERDRIEAALTQEERDYLGGVGQPDHLIPEIVRDYQNALGDLDYSTPEGLGDSLRYAITKIGEKTDPKDMNPTEQLAYAQMRMAFEHARKKGWDAEAISKKAIEESAKRWRDPADAAFMLRRFIKNEEPTSPKGLPEPEPHHSQFQPRDEEGKFSGEPLIGSISEVPRNASVKEGEPHGLSASSEYLRNITSTTAFREHGLGGFDVPTQRLVMSRVFSALHDDKIREIVVQRIPVDVVNNFMKLQSAPEVLFHDPTVLVSFDPINPRSQMTLLRKSADSLIRVVAELGAEHGFVGSDISLSSKLNPTLKTGELGHVKSPSETIIPKGSGISPPRPEEPRMTGVRQKSREAMAEEGRAAEYKPGVGTTGPEMKELGRKRLREGVDPVAHIAMMEKRGAGATGEDMAIIAAHDDALVDAADKARDALRKDPNNPELKAAYEKADKAEKAWFNRIMPFKTESHKTFVAQQGEVDLNTGSFTSMARHFENINKRPMDEREVRQAEEYVSRVNDLEKQLADIQTKLDAQITKHQARQAASTAPKRLPKDAKGLAEHFAKRKMDGGLYGTIKKMPSEAGAVRIRKGDPNFTTEEVRAIWDYAKQYIGMGDPAKKGTFDFAQVVSNTSRDLGLSEDEVIFAFTQNKTVSRKLVDDAYVLSSARRRTVSQAKVWNESANNPAYGRALNAVNQFPRAVAVFGHGTVGMTTHAGPNIFRPSSWQVYWPSVLKQWEVFLGKPGTSGHVVHERMMMSIENDPRYGMKLQAGLKVDPNKIYDSWQEYSRYLSTGKAPAKVLGVFHEIAKRGDRGMDVLKLFRSKYFDLEWDRLPKDMQTPEMAKNLAEWVNHASGSGDIETPKGSIGKAAEAVMFAPSLEAARWSRVLGDPIKTARVTADALLNKGRKYTPEDRAIAVFRVKRAAELSSVYVAALAANYGLQSATGQKDKVNFTDPLHADWLRFKWNGKTLDPTGGAVAPLRFLSSVLKDVGKADIRAVGGQAIQYGRGKLSPFYGIVVDVTTGKDFMGRPMPFASEQEKAKARASGKQPLTYGELAWEHAPIPVSGVAREVYDTYRENGVDDKMARAIVNGLMVAPFELTGIRVGKSSKAYVKPIKGRAPKDPYAEPKEFRGTGRDPYREPVFK